MYSTIRQVKSLNIFFGEESLKNKSFEVQQGDYNSNEVSALLYAPDEKGKAT